jgi:uncharacterized LabA/DUF88 family protein
MSREPKEKRAIVFFDGQNLFRMVKTLWGKSYPDYDILALARLVCSRNNWNLAETRFYTGIPTSTNPNTKMPDRRRPFWDNKINAMRQQGIVTFTREIHYHPAIEAAGNRIFVAQEKGIDIRIAIDAMSAMINNRCDVVVLFSQDQDFSEVAKESRVIASRFYRWIMVASAYPQQEAAGKVTRGINSTNWLPISRTDYESCIDVNNY